MYENHSERMKIKIERYISRYISAFGKRPTVSEIMIANNIRTKKTVDRYLEIRK